jgi:hypothetical protein
MKDILLTIAENDEPVVKTCILSGREFELKKGLAYTCEGQPVAPDVAQNIGYKFNDSSNLPSRIDTRDKLTRYLRDEIKIKTSDPLYIKYYKHWSNYLPPLDK